MRKHASLQYIALSFFALLKRKPSTGEKSFKKSLVAFMELKNGQQKDKPCPRDEKGKFRRVYPAAPEMEGIARVPQPHFPPE